MIKRRSDYVIARSTDLRGIFSGGGARNVRLHLVMVRASGIRALVCVSDRIEIAPFARTLVRGKVAVWSRAYRTDRFFFARCASARAHALICDMIASAYRTFSVVASVVVKPLGGYLVRTGRYSSDLIFYRGVRYRRCQNHGSIAYGRSFLTRIA